MRRKSVVIFIILAILILAGCSSTASTPAPAKQTITQQSTAVTNAAYIGNSNSFKFHKSSCTWAGKISPSNRVTFRSRDEAIKEGYDPCKVCKP